MYRVGEPSRADPRGAGCSVETSADHGDKRTSCPKPEQAQVRGATELSIADHGGTRHESTIPPAATRTFGRHALAAQGSAVSTWPTWSVIPLEEADMSRKSSGVRARNEGLV